MKYFLLLACVFLQVANSSSARSQGLVPTGPRIQRVQASSAQSGHPASDAFDNRSSTRWAALGKGQWLEVVLSSPVDLSAVQIGFDRGNRTYSFRVDAWTGKAGSGEPVRSGEYESDGSGNAVQEYLFAARGVQRLRLSNFGNSENDWINIHTLLLPGVHSVVGADAAVKASVAREKEETGLEFFRWSGKLNIPDPVALSFDPQGRCYVTQTQRRKSQDLDIRQHSSWIPDDVGLDSVAAKRRFLRSQLGTPESPRSAADAPVPDHNQDGQRDYRDLTVLSERLHVVCDTNGDGTADSIDLFADGFQTEVTGIAAGVLWYDGHVYTTIAPDVWQLTDIDGDGVADERRRTATGFGLHIAYAGHDMHGLTVGPDGRIYWTIGDKGISVTTEEGRRFHYPNQGGVMRCNPDGTGFEVFAHGLRNVQELAFDDFGNLFGVDNDSDQPGERERVVFIPEGTDAGWRCNYQYRGGDYNPWMKEGLWQTSFEEQPAYIHPPLKYSLNGPAGFTRNPGTALGPEWKDYYFLAGAPGGEQIAFRLVPQGAGFAVRDERAVGNGIPLVGINFGPDGGLYGVDWGGGYPLNRKGAIWMLDVPADQRTPARAETQALLKTGFRDFSAEQLIDHLGHADRRVRLGAQFELVRRQAFETLTSEALDAQASLLCRVHAIQGLAQLLRTHLSEADTPEELWKSLLRAREPQIRIQALRAVGEVPGVPSELLLRGLSDHDPAVVLAALLAVHRKPHPEAVPLLIQHAAALQPGQVTLRHGIAFGLSGCMDEHLANRLAQHPSPVVRQVAVVAIRHLMDPSRPDFRIPGSWLVPYLTDAVSAVSTEAALAVQEHLGHLPLAEIRSRPDVRALAACADNPPQIGEAFLRRVMNANFLIGDHESGRRLAALAADESVPSVLRLEALAAIRLWDQPEWADRVDGRRRVWTEARADLAKSGIGSYWTAMLASEKTEIRAAALATSVDVGLIFSQSQLSQLAEIFSRLEAPATLRLAAQEILAERDWPALSELLVEVVRRPDDSAPVRVAALRGLAQEKSGAVLAVLRDLLKPASLARKERQRVTVLQEALLIASSLGTPEADALLQELAAFRLSEDQPTAMDLELREALLMRASESPAITAAMQQWDKRRQASDDDLAGWADCLLGGNQDEGRRLFETHVTAACARCHRTGDKGSTVGPNLVDVASRHSRRFLLQSVVRPSAEIHPQYRAQTVLLASGKVLQGLPVRETADTLVMADSRGELQTIPRDEVEELIERDKSIMPELTEALTRREIRDIIAYLCTLGTPGATEEELPVLFTDDFSDGAARWEFSDPEGFAVQSDNGDPALAILNRRNNYEPPIRSPYHRALIRDIEVSDFELTFDVQGPNNTGNHRDCCIFFGYTDEEHYYYVHLGAVPDPASGQIMIVNEAPRTPLTKNQKRTPWTEAVHKVRVRRNSRVGTITVYFDDMTTPHMVIEDKTFPTGRVGIGSFDDINRFDNVVLKGRPLAVGDR